MRFISLCIISLLLCTSSCTIEKRHYRKGFYFHHQQRAYINAEKITENEKTEQKEQVVHKFSNYTADTFSLVIQRVPAEETQTLVSSSENAVIIVQPEERVSTIEKNITPNQEKTIPLFVPEMAEPSGAAIAITTIAMLLAIVALVLLIIAVFQSSMVIAANYLLGSLITSITGCVLSLIALIINYRHPRNEQLRLLSIIAMMLSVAFLLASFVTLLAMAVVGSI